MSAPASAGGDRVLAVIDTAGVSGPGRQLTALAGALAASGSACRVVLFHRAGRPHPGFAEFLAAAGVDHVVLRERGRVDPGVVRALARTIADFAPTVVQTHSYKANALVALLRARGLRTPWIASFHGATTEDLKVRAFHWLDQRVMRRADAIVVMSAAHRASIPGARVIYNATIPPRASGAPLDTAPFRARAMAAGAPLVGVVGRLSSEKGVDVFLDALALLRDRGRAVHALVAGDGPDRDALKQQAERLGLADAVHFVGPVADVAALYPALDAVVLPSRSEGLPNVLLEALSADRPVVATRVGAVPEVLTDAAAGVVVPPGDAPALADAIAAALSTAHDPAARAARAETAARFSLARRVDAHRALYRELAARA